MVQVEVAGITALAILIALLGQYNFVYKAASLPIRWRKPWNVRIAESLLQRLKQRHEIPYRKDVILHENMESFHRINVRIYRMFQQRPSKRRQPIMDPINRIHRRKSLDRRKVNGRTRSILIDKW